MLMQSEVKTVLASCFKSRPIVGELNKPLSPKTSGACYLTSSHMDCHDHSYTQIVIGLKGQAEFEVSGFGNMVGPGQGCVVTSGSGHWWGCRAVRYFSA